MTGPRQLFGRIVTVLVVLALTALAVVTRAGGTDHDTGDRLDRLEARVDDLTRDDHATAVRLQAAEAHAADLDQRVAELEAALFRTDTRVNGLHRPALAETTRYTAASAPAGDAWPAMAACESTGDDDGVAPHRIDKRATSTAGPGYFGALQWTMSTWHDAGGTGDPRDATLDEELARGAAWAARPDVDAAGQWPTCWPAVGRRLGIPR